MGSPPGARPLSGVENNARWTRLGASTSGVSVGSPPLRLRFRFPRSHPRVGTRGCDLGKRKRRRKGGDPTLTPLVDAPSLVHRALFSTPDSGRAPGGEPINAAYGFLNMLARLVADQDPDRLPCAGGGGRRPQGGGGAA